MSRYICVTQRIKTEFGKLYAHVDVSPSGEIEGVGYTSPGKFADTAIGDLLYDLAQTPRDIINDISSR